MSNTRRNGEKRQTTAEVTSASYAKLGRSTLVGAISSIEGVVVREPEKWIEEVSLAFKDLDVWCSRASLCLLLPVLGDHGLHETDSNDARRRWCGVVNGKPCVIDIDSGPITEAVLNGCEANPERARHLLEFSRSLQKGRLPSEATRNGAREAWSGVDEEKLIGMSKRLPSIMLIALSLNKTGKVPAIAAVARVASFMSVCKRLRQIPEGVTSGAVAAFLKDRMRPEAGKLVVVVGTDGSGKSTMCDSVVESLRCCGVETERVYMGSIRNNARAVASLRRRVSGVYNKTGRKSRLVAVVGRIVLCLDSVWRYKRDVAPLLRDGTTVVCDRWICDIGLTPEPGSPLLAGFVEAVVPRADVAVLAHAPVDVIVARRRDTSSSIAARNQAYYNRWLGRSRARRKVTADTTDTSSDAVEIVVASVLAARSATLPFRAQCK